MEALVLTRPSLDGKPVLTVETRSVPVPRAAANEVLIQVKASKVNPSDALNVNGGFPYTVFPRVPGRDYSGTIVAAPGNPVLIGADVFGTSGNRLGFSEDGAQAQFMLLKESWIVRKPVELTHAQAASIGVVYSTALLMIRRAQLEVYGSQKFTALIIGESGNVGSAIRSILEARFPDSVIAPANRVDGQMVLPKDRRFDVVFSTVPNTAVLQEAVSSLLEKRGRLVFIATTRPTSEKLQIDPLQFYRDELSLIGVNSINCSMEEVRSLMSELAEMFTKKELSLRGEAFVSVSLKDGVETYRNFANSKQDLVFMMGTE